jgi:hypothetical protein
MSKLRGPCGFSRALAVAPRATAQSEGRGGQIREEHTHDSRAGVGWFALFANPTGVYAPGPGAVLDTANRSR